MSVRYSIVVPIFNEEEVLPELYKRMSALLDTLDGSAEVIAVNDGSRDRSLEILRDINAKDPRFKVISFSRNFGHQMALTAGLDYAQGDAVIAIDADLQDPPEVIHDLIAQWKNGYDVVLAVRSERLGETIFKKLTASLFYRLINRLTDLKIPVDSGDFRLMSRKVIDSMRLLREQHRYMRGLSVWVGFKQTQVQYVRQERYAGTTKYPLKKMLRFATNAITSFSYVPLQVATNLGMVFAVLGFLGLPIIGILRLEYGEAFLGGQATTLSIVLFMGGVQLIFLGIIGEYLGRIYDEVKRRPLYLVGEFIGFEQNSIPLKQTGPLSYLEADARR